mmetsp:Transcript_22157/g.61656  ORF Transcript_22157/g.61656 Transcript_22157/m.61656 type:complete len:273 (+) Transcript_22157:1256-2074(+)
MVHGVIVIVIVIVIGAFGRCQSAARSCVRRNGNPKSLAHQWIGNEGSHRPLDHNLRCVARWQRWSGALGRTGLGLDRIRQVQSRRERRCLFGVCRAALLFGKLWRGGGKPAFHGIRQRRKVLRQGTIRLGALSLQLALGFLLQLQLLLPCSKVSLFRLFQPDGIGNGLQDVWIFVLAELVALDRIVPGYVGTRIPLLAGVHGISHHKSREGNFSVQRLCCGHRSRGIGSRRLCPFAAVRVGSRPGREDIPRPYRSLVRNSPAVAPSSGPVCW